MATRARSSIRNLSGAWQGQYRYSWGKAVSFLASIAQSGSSIVGDTVEPKGGGKFAVRTANVSGGCSGTGIHFIKNYLQPSDTHCYPITYEGQVSDDRKTITGRWKVRGMSGTFEMHREAEVEEGASVHETVAVDIAIGVYTLVRGDKS